jgi:hypothetical protein
MVAMGGVNLRVPMEVDPPPVARFPEMASWCSLGVAGQTYSPRVESVSYPPVGADVVPEPVCSHSEQTSLILAKGPEGLMAEVDIVSPKEPMQPILGLSQYHWLLLEYQPHPLG